MKLIKCLATALASLGLASAHSYELKEIDSKWIDERDGLNYAYIDTEMNESNLVELTKLSSSGKWTIDIQNGLTGSGDRLQVRLLSPSENAHSIKLKQNRRWFDQNSQLRQSSFEVNGSSEEINEYLKKARRRDKQVLFFSKPAYSSSFLISIKR